MTFSGLYRATGLVLIITFLPALTGCGESPDGGENSPATGVLTVRITDAAVDTAVNAYIQYLGIEIQTASGNRLLFYYCRNPVTDDPFLGTAPCVKPDPSKQFDMLTLTDGVSAFLLRDQSLPAGRVDWIRLLVSTAVGRDSYLVFDRSRFELTIPSGAESGLKLDQGFDVSPNGSADFTIDFDMRKSVQLASTGKYILRPSLRIVDTQSAGSIAGSVDPRLITGPPCVTCCTPAVYVYTGQNIVPDDIDGNNPEPVTTAIVKQDDTSGDYRYRAAFLEPGGYTVAFTCEAGFDNSATDDSIIFILTSNVVVAAGIETIHNFFF